MKTKSTVVVIMMSMIVAGSFMTGCSSHDSKSTEHAAQSNAATPSHSPQHARQPVVPHFMSAVDAHNLPPTLAPAQFIGKQREAYEVARKIPTTLAQLPCYCYCDQGFGHKSLHTCFVDNHAAQCAVCVDEALLAYRLQKDGMNPDQIRKVIIEKYSKEL